MKLVFPGGEHPQVLLGHGVNRVGSDPDSTVVINRPGVLPQHCLLHVTAQGVMLDVPHGTTMSVNGRQVAGLIALRPGDSVGFDQVQAQLAALGPAPAVRRQGGPVGRVPDSANDDPGVTAVRAVLPRFVLRGASPEVAGRNAPVFGVLTVGRGSECGLRLEASGMSRVHARLLPTKSGLLLEDLGSSNGSFINGQRVLRGEVRVGDEIGFDTLRFRLVTSAQGAPVQIVAKPVRAAGKTHSRAGWHWVAAAVLAVAAIAGVAVLR
ncbi:FHA domain-containing protein [Lysobacter cavernae]|uniref:FHA domain-containing protein n=1 Tax=Lysobacter cavernae TaxID=1685901 RepID=A0ABV7RMP6_9GAMM